MEKTKKKFPGLKHATLEIIFKLIEENDQPITSRKIKNELEKSYPGIEKQEGNLIKGGYSEEDISTNLTLFFTAMAIEYPDHIKRYKGKRPYEIFVKGMPKKFLDTAALFVFMRNINPRKKSQSAKKEARDKCEISKEDYPEFKREFDKYLSEKKAKDKLKDYVTYEKFEEMVKAVNKLVDDVRELKEQSRELKEQSRERYQENDHRFF